MKTYRIHLLRHGLTLANYEGKYVGSQTDLPISPESLTSLRSLSETVQYPSIDALYSSPMLRCRQSAAVLYPDMPLMLVEDLREIDFGDFENKSAELLANNIDYLKWTSGTIPSPPNGESTMDFTQRICVGINGVVRDMMQKSAYDAAVIMHGGAIMMLLASCAVPRRKSVEWTCEPGRGYSVLITPSLYHSSGVMEVYDTV